MENLKDLPLRYQKKPKSNYYEDTHTGKLIHKDSIHKFTKSFLTLKDELIREKRYDLKYDN